MRTLIHVCTFICSYTGTFPTKSPNPNSRKFVFSWAHPSAWISALFCLIHFLMILEFIYSIYLEPGEATDSVDAFMLYVFAIAVGISDLAIRITTIVYCMEIIGCITSIRKSKIISPERSRQRKCCVNAIRTVYILASILYLIYSVVKVYHLELSPHAYSHSVLVDLAEGKPGLQKFLRGFTMTLFVTFDMLHHLCFHFAFSFIYLIGVELGHQFEDLCDYIVNIKNESDYDYLDVVDFEDLKEDFMALKNCFVYYSVVGGIFFMAMWLEILPDGFRAIAHLVFYREFDSINFALFLSGAIVGTILLFLVIDAAHWLSVAVAVGKDQLTDMVYGGDVGYWGHEGEMAVAKMILYWNWGFDAAGMFSIDRGLIPAVFGIYVTWLLVVADFKITGDCGEAAAAAAGNGTK